MFSKFIRISKKTSRRLDLLANSRVARAIREGLLWVVPILLLSELLLFSSIAGSRLGTSADISMMLLAGHKALASLIPLLIAGAIAYFLSMQHRLPRLPIAFLCLAQTMLASIIWSSAPHLYQSLGVTVAMTTPLLVVPFMDWLTRLRYLPSIRAGIVSDNLRDMLNTLLPGLISTAVFILLAHLLRDPFIWFFDYYGALPDQSHPYLSGLIVTGLDSLLWFFGIHGYHALAPMFQQLDMAVISNAVEFAQTGTASRILNSSQLAAFVFIGGSGSTFSLALCLVFFCRNKTLRLLGIASLPLAFMNVNEILLFGLPIILNPRLFIPFMLVPMLNLIISMTAISLGFVSPATTHLPMTSPMFFNAYWASGGELNAVWLQLALIALSTWLYLPFVKKIEQRGMLEDVIPVRSLDTTFTRMHEEAALYSYDPISQAISLRKQYAEENRHIKKIAEYEFFLEYQPQICNRTGLCTSCEALLRARSPAGKVRAPAEFLGWLERSQLICTLDLWVANAAIEQYKHWREYDNFHTAISINITGRTLASTEHRKKLIELLTPVGSDFIVEITEGTLLDNIDSVKEGLLELGRIGVRVAIDDFGTGYSALSYLHQFSIDKIKIDRSFVMAAETRRGKNILQAILAFAERLGLEVVIEGIETTSQLQQFKTQKDLLIQGWLYSRSLPPADYVQYVQQLHNRQTPLLTKRLLQPRQA